MRFPFINRHDQLPRLLECPRCHSPNQRVTGVCANNELSIDPSGTTYPNDWGDLPHNPLDDFLAVSVAVDCGVCKRSHYFQLRAGEKYGVYALAVKDFCDD